MPKQVFQVPVPGGKIYAATYGDGLKPAIVFIHGGPGFSCEPCELVGSDQFSDRTVIFYDQLDVGRSECPNDPKNWHTQRFVDELQALRDFLKLDEVVLWGYSWGTMILTDYLLQDPKPVGVQAAIFSSPCLSASGWKSDADRLIAKLPLPTQQAIEKHTAQGDYENDAYQQAMMEYYRQFACRLDPWPDYLVKSFESSNKEQYLHMWGPSEFQPTGVLKSYERLDRLREISVPSLFTCGRFDESTPETVALFQKEIAGSQMVVFENSAHMAIFEETNAYFKALRDFLA